MLEFNTNMFKRKKVPLMGNGNDMLKSTVIIPTSSIIIQFSLLEDFEYMIINEYFNIKNITVRKNKYERLPVSKRLDMLEQLENRKFIHNIKRAYKALSDYRNKIAHEKEYYCDVPQYAFNYFFLCNAVAYYLNDFINNNNENYDNIICFWNKVLDNRFKSDMDCSDYFKFDWFVEDENGDYQNLTMNVNV